MLKQLERCIAIALRKKPTNQIKSDTLELVIETMDTTMVITHEIVFLDACFHLSLKYYY